MAKICFAITIAEIAPNHPRPFLLQDQHKQAILDQIASQSWAKEEFKQLKEKALQGDGHSAAFIYALTEESEFLIIAKSWLLKISKQGGDLGVRAKDANDEYFQQGMPWLGDVFYQTGTDYFEAFDFIYNGLNQDEIEIIESGILTSAKFRSNAMNTWWQTANLVFKPTSMVAIAGLVTQNNDLLNWGFFREPSNNLGGYFPTLNIMLKDNGPWHEAPTYAVAHQPLIQSLKISHYLTQMTGKNWFDEKLASGSSVKGLMDYYIKSTYPKEIQPDGSYAYRILTYGDGATGQYGDFYLINQNPHQASLIKELAFAYHLSKNPDYALFLSLFKDYQPSIIGKTELPLSPLLPRAQSSIWPEFGLVFLRSDNHPSYWKNPNAIATSMLFQQGYGHGHADALSITLFGAGKLFYPDYNAIQYENPAVGWTASSVAHNTVMVDGSNSLTPLSVAVQHEFNGDVDFIKTDVEEPLGITKIRTLSLTSDYLLDVFHVKSRIPKTYDYLLHSFGEIKPSKSLSFTSSHPFSTRLKGLNSFMQTNTNNNWSVDFIIDLERQMKNSMRLVDKLANDARPKKTLVTAFGLDRTDHFRESKINFQMLNSVSTTIGIGEDDYGLSLLAARRKNTNKTTFIALHTPSYLDENKDQINSKVLIDNDLGSLIRISTDQFVDFHAISHHKDVTNLTSIDNEINIAYNNYAILRINKSTGKSTTYGDWLAYSFSANQSGVNKSYRFGENQIKQPHNNLSSDQSIQVNTYPKLVVLKNFADSQLTVSLTNKSNQPISAKIELQDHPDYDIPIKHYSVGPVAPNQSVNQQITLGRYHNTSGIGILPIDIKINESNQILEGGILVSTGPGLMHDFKSDEPVYKIYTHNGQFDFGMRAGFIKKISDNKHTELYSGPGLFSLSDGSTIFSLQLNNIKTSYTWPNSERTSLISEINNQIRSHNFFIQDRIYFSLDKTYTRIDEVLLSFDKSQDHFDWSNLRYLSDKKITNLIKNSRSEISTKAVELPFTRGQKSFCLASKKPRLWQNTHGNISMPIYRDREDQISMGLCDKGSLATWVNQGASD